MRFAIITPTIGRATLSRCLITMAQSVYKDFEHFVVGDGPQSDWVKKQAFQHRCQYLETPKREGFYGTGPRNFALEAIESGAYGAFDYIVFVDDDNVLLEPTLYNIVHGPAKSMRPGIIWWDVLFTNKYMTRYDLLPKGREPLVQGDWDSLSAAYRADAVRSLRWRAVYRHDWEYGHAALSAARGSITRLDMVGGVHFLSWDTYEPEKPGAP
jgi:glycosyltransferase involved in cell wall biosynthesis